MLFEGQRPRRRVAPTWPASAPRAELDFSGYVLDQVQLHECDYNWKTFIEVYLEDYHVGAVPPGARPVRHLRRPALGVRRAPLGADGGRRRRRSRKPGSPVYRKLARRGARRTATACRRPARRDLAHLLPERDGRVVSARAGGLDAASRKGPQKTLNVVEFYYPEEIAAFEREFVEAAAGRLHGDLRRGRRDRAAHGRRPARRCCERGDDEPARTRARWKTACSTSTSGTAGAWAECAVTPRPPDAGATDAVRVVADGRARRFLFATMGVCVKLASARLPPGEIVFYRGLIGALLMLAPAPAGAAARCARRVPAMHFWRSVVRRDLAVPVVLRHRRPAAGHRDDAELHVVGVDGAVPDRRRGRRSAPRASTAG